MQNRNLNLIILFFALISFSSNMLTAAELRNEAAPVRVEVISDHAYSMRLNIEVEDVKITKVNIADVDFDLFSIIDEPNISKEGWPDLPFVARTVLVPPQSGIRIEIEDIEYSINSDFSPAIAPRDNNGEYEHIGEVEEFTSRQGFWPSAPLVLGEPAIFRGWRLINFRFYPVQYNRSTGETKFNDNVTFDIVYEGVGDNIVTAPGPKKSSIFAYRFLSNLVENPPPMPDRDDLNTASYLYIIPEVDGVEEIIEPLLEWRRRQGHRVAVEWVQNGANSGTIDNLIEEYYESEDPVEFVALVGDATGGASIRLNAASADGDYNYSRQDGNDPLPDIAIGRISADRTQALETIVEKLVPYEMDPYMDDTDWYRRGTVIAGYTNNGLSTVLLAKYVRTELLNVGFDEVLSYYHTEDGGNISGNQPFLVNAVESGISILHYRAYSHMNSLNTGVITGMRNRDGRWPAVLAISCATGWFVREALAHTEAFLRARGGGIGAIGTATLGTSVQYNNIMAGGVWKGIYKQELYAFGWGLNTGKYALWRAYHGFDGRYMNFMDWNNLMGDPGTIIWTDIPLIIDVDHVQEIEAGNGFVHTIVIDENDERVPDALVCLYKGDELHITKYTDDNGRADFHFDGSELSDGEILITVTKHNVKPYLSEIEIVEPEYFLGITDLDIDDDNEGASSGDGDDVANPGETIEINIEYTNLGENVPDGNGTISLESNSIWAEVTGDDQEFDESPGAGETGNAIFTIEIDPACPDQESIGVIATITVGDGEFTSGGDFTVDSPRITVDTFSFEDGDFDPGDVERLNITLRNVGHKDLAAFTATLTSGNDLLRALDPEANYRPIGMNRTGTVDGDRFRLGAHPFTIPATTVEITLSIETEGGFTDETSFVIQVGTKEDGDPLGPDNYGYICLDSDDDDWEFVPEYDWVEIDQREDRFDFRGTNLNLRDSGDNQDRSTAVDLPFEFTYYGEPFDIITVCSNGWAAMGDQEELADFRNRHIAQALGPNAQLCVWWDNLVIPNSGGVFAHYDEDGGRFIIEWNGARRLLNGGGLGATETFEIILLDPEIHPTITGDGMIIFQYKEVDNQNQAARNDTPFCTIGISNLDDSDGIEYTYWNQFPAGAKEIENEMALLFITRTDFRTGILSGTITDVGTGEPIPGAEILTSRSFWAETDEEGNYEIDVILVDEGYSVTAFIQGWNDSTVVGIDIIEDEVTEVNFSLLHPEFESSDMELERMLEIDDTVNLNFILSNHGNGPLDWRVERHLRGDANAEPWDFRREYMVAQVVDDARIQGVVFANDRYYVSGGNNRDPVIYVLNRGFELIETLDQPIDNDSKGMRDLAWDGELIWGACNNLVYALDPEGNVIHEWESPYNFTSAITYDPNLDVIWIAYTTNNLIGFTREGERIEDLEIDRKGLRIYGLAYWPEDPDDYTIYAYHKEIVTGRLTIHKFNPDSGDTLFVNYIDRENAGTPSSSFITNEFDVYSWVMINITDASRDDGGDRVDIWQLDARKDWYLVEPEVGLINQGEEQEFTLTLDATGLPAVTFEGDLVYYHNAIGGETRIAVTLDVFDGDRPIQRTMSLNQGWNMVSLNIIPEEDDLREMFQPIVERDLLNLVKDGLGRFYSPENDYNNIPGWAVEDGYQIHVSEAVEIDFEGVPVEANRPIPLVEGWNLKSYFSQEPANAIEVLANIEEQLIIAKNGLGRFYIPEYGYSNIGNLDPGQGYQMKVTEDTELVYNLGDRLATDIENQEAPVHFPSVSTGESNMSILIIGAGSNNDWEIAVNDENGNIIGSGRFSGQGNCGIAAWGSEPHQLSFTIWDGQSERNLEIKPLHGTKTWSRNGILVAELINENLLPQEFGISSAYPNPFNSAVKIRYGLVKPGEVSLRIFDLSGRKVVNLISESQEAGWHSFSWNADNYSSGLYLTRLEQKGKVSQTKLILVK